MTLNEVKEALSVDFTDNDAYIQSLIDCAMERAKVMVGTTDIYNLDGEIRADVRQAIIQDVASMYQARDGSATSLGSTIIYRSISQRPMF